ncbi:hypothetical protein F341_027 [Campylobacter phage F341]|uniref:Uncharacterized protein n=1 Tax=Campylobacter phage CP81 TaxID=2927008 RepID=G0LWU5_9CAUD|nr:hypothetical protein FDJ37_gp120 [Campylobacter phage CP81]WJZ70127.1 hypothetical protein F341_027 [Campylobacter phage F341]CBZ42287.1 hypothetical protein [Campylobacter phage CP81]
MDTFKSILILLISAIMLKVYVILFLIISLGVLYYDLTIGIPVTATLMFISIYLANKFEKFIS